MTLERKIETAFQTLIGTSVDAYITGGILNAVSLVTDTLETDHIASVCRTLEPTGEPGLNRSGHWQAQCEIKVVTDLSGRADSTGTAVDLVALHDGRCDAVRYMIYVEGLATILSAAVADFSVIGWMLGNITHETIGNSWVTRHFILLRDCTESVREILP